MAGDLLQPTLFGAGGPERLALDGSSWVEVWRAWLGESEAAGLFDHLGAHAGWEQRTRWMYSETVLEPRLTAEYPDLRRSGSPALLAVADRLTRQYGPRYDGAWINLYRDGHDSTGWHGDRFTCKGPTAIVPVLSLGATRRFLLRPATGGRSRTIVVAGGDLVVMGGRCQRDWRHCVPKETHPVGPRISVNFTSPDQRQPLRPTGPVASS